MMFRVAGVLTLIAVAASKQLPVDEEQQIVDAMGGPAAAPAQSHPVSKVTAILKDMLKTMEKEQEEDEEVYDKLACWCATNDREKTKAIKDAEARIAELEAAIEEDIAISARLNTEIKNTEQEVAKNQKALDEATAIREKELAEFNEEEKEMLQAISALKSAIVVLSKHHAAAFIQVPQSHMMSVAATLQHLTQTHADKLQGVLTHKERRAVESFIKSPEAYFDQQPTFLQQKFTPGYQAQSGEIFGILEQMRETFEKDLGESSKAEAENQKAYEELKAAKEEQIKAGQDQIAAKTQELADTDERLAHNQQDIEDTKNSLSADEKFLMDLKERCSMTDEEWERRQKTRAAEMEAVSKALTILNSEESHDLFARTFSFAQVQVEVHSQRREAASRLLSKVASKLHSPRLSALATRVKLDAFERVKAAIDEMVQALLEEKAAEVKHFQFCQKELQENAMQTEKKEYEKQKLEALIETLESDIKELTEAIERLQDEIAETTKQIKIAGEDREKENQEFQAVIADQRGTQKVLAAALAALGKFYGVKEEPVLAQQNPPPPPGFSEYKKSSASAGVMDLIKNIISDAKALEAETIRAEEDAQKAYEDFVIQSNDVIEAKKREIVAKTAEKAKKQQELVEAKESRDKVVLELEQLGNYAAQLHSSCDFIMKNFELRQTARDEEIEALRQAKQILSGAKFDEFIQLS